MRLNYAHRGLCIIYSLLFSMFQKLYKACLLVAREAGRIVGCVGIESRTMVNGKLAAPGVIEDMRVGTITSKRG